MVPDSMIPENFETWRNCITLNCGIKLSKAFAQQRLVIYKQLAHSETKEFIRLYGLSHYQNIVTWLEIIEKRA